MNTGGNVRGWYAWFFIAVIAMIGGCGTVSPDPERGKSIDIQFLKQGTAAAVNMALAKFSDETDPRLQPYLKSLQPFFKYTWQAYRVAYYTTTDSGQLIPVSGLMVIPIGTLFQRLSVPILSLQHPTQVERQFSPSSLNMSDPLLTVPLALALASTGYIVLAPDYPGLGIDPGPHPYCHRSLAAAVIDLLRAARDSNELRNSRTVWNRRLFLMGYSEGGYATLVTARELQLHHAGEFTVTAAAPLDGPYSLSVVMRKVMLAENPDYHDPYYLPYTLRGYDALYASTVECFQFDTAVKTVVPDYLPPAGSSYAAELYTLLDGNHSCDEIDAFMRLATPYRGPCSILTDTFLADLQNADSPLCRTLAQNDACGDWTPAMPIKFFHNPQDDLVPAENATLALDTFLAAGADSVTLELFDDYIPNLGSIHAGAAPVAYTKAFLWLDTFAYPARHP